MPPGDAPKPRGGEACVQPVVQVGGWAVWRAPHTPEDPESLARGTGRGRIARGTGHEGDPCRGAQELATSLPGTETLRGHRLRRLRTAHASLLIFSLVCTAS